MKNSKAKGASAEREIVNLLKTWWNPYEPDAKFSRTPGSGGWASGRGRADYGTAADIVTTSKTFPFAVEVKNREGWSVEGFLATRKSPVWGWWAQAVKQGAEMKKIPLLVFRKNRVPWRALLPENFRDIWMPNPEVEFLENDFFRNHVEVPAVCYRFDSLLAIRPEKFVSLGTEFGCVSVS